jgi:hypothetical protein
MEHQHANSFSVQVAAEAGSMLGAVRESASATQETIAPCRAPDVHEAWRRCSSGVFATCPMCYRDSLSDRPLSHH